MIFALLLTSAALSGCVERRLIFSSNIQDIKVQMMLDGEPIGTAPTTVYFENYGERDWQARAEGYQTAGGRVELAAPWYQWPLFDFFSEVLIPFTIVDQVHVEVKLRPLEERETSGLLERANDYREEAIKEVSKVPAIGDKKR